VSANSAAPPGTITLTCPDSADNTYAATIHYNPATGGAIDLSIPGGDTVTAVTLADDGITNWGQVQNTGLTVN
jgi:hypothetical protein